MIEIVYDSEREHMFTLRYELHKYIPDLFFEKYPQYTELHFIQKLFDSDSNIRFICEKPIIWSTDYIYEFREIKFTLSLDEDYDFIDFMVENPKYRSEIAEHICGLIEHGKY